MEIYAVVSSLIFGILLFSAFTKPKQTFDEITVQRLNVVEKNGQLIMVAANSDRMPDPIVNGKTFKAERPPGMIFFNGLGDENGGFVFGAVKKDDYYGAYQGITFDKFKQAQTMALMYNDKKGKYRAGLQIWNWPETPLDEILTRQEEIAKMPDGEGKSLAAKKLQEDNFSPTRIYVGKNADKESEVTLSDAKGKVRIKMSVGADGNPKLDFFDENGAITYSLPADGKAKK